jgi:hypothetical protein
MRRNAILGALGTLMVVGAVGGHAATLDEDGANWTITTDLYTITWNTDAQAGYSSIIPAGNDEIDLFGAGGRNVYHSANYAGWKDWGAAAEADVVEETAGKIVLSFEMEDGASKVYHATTTFWDGVPYWKNEVTVEAVADVASFGDGHEPMCEPRAGGADNEYEKWDAPFAHVAFANDNGFFAMYTEEGAARTHAWQVDGRMDLTHDNLVVNLNEGEMSDPIVYYMATGTGDLDDAHDLADIVTKLPAEVLAVSAKAKLATSWGDMKRK